MTSSVWHRALVALSGCTLLLTCAAHHSPFDTPTLLRSVHQATCLNSMFVQTPAQTSGPFYLPAPERADITEGKPGTPLNLTVIVRDKNCKAFPAGTRVSIWHTDSSGLYSGYETAPDGGNPVDARGDMFMRGELPTNVDGRVTFNTIVPGWYRNRPVHIHAKVFYGDSAELTTQFYFKEEFLKEVSQQSSYADRGDPDTTNEDEGVPETLIVDVQGDKNGYTAEYAVGIDIEAGDLYAGGDSENQDEDVVSAAAGSNQGEDPKDSSGCFPAEARLVIEGGLERRMDELKVGDRVLVAPGIFSDIFAFTHRSANFVNEFVTLTFFTTGEQLSLTPGHYIPVDGELVAASSVLPGATLLTGSAREVVVAEVRREKLEGLYNPQTLHGDIVVNGIVVSTYTTAVKPGVAHSALGVARLGYRWSGGVDMTCGILEDGAGQRRRYILDTLGLSSDL